MSFINNIVLQRYQEALRNSKQNTIHKIRVPITIKITTTLERIQKLSEAYYKSLNSEPDEADRLTTEKFLALLDLPSIRIKMRNF